MGSALDTTLGPHVFGVNYFSNTPNHELEDLINHTNALKCSDPSSSFPPLLLPPPTDSVSPPSLTLAGKIMSLKPVSSSTIKTNLLQAWHF
jgi:hypothetical protein